MSNSANYDMVRDGLLAMHRLFVKGEKNTPEVKAIRDATDEPWTDLTEEEQEAIQGLSIDLYQIEGVKQADTGLAQQEAAEKMQDAYFARDACEYDRALALLRECQAYSSDAGGNYLRGTVWQRKGDPKAASVFMRRAVDLAPANSNFRAVWLHLLKEADPESAKAEAEKVLSTPRDFEPSALLYACEIAYFQASPPGDFASLPVYRRLIPVVEEAVARMRERRPQPSPSLFGMALSLLASCHEHLQEFDEAYHSYSEGIRFNPKNAILYVARGKLLYGKDPSAASDFEKAIQLKSPVAWPYLFLCHDHLGTGRFEEARKLADAGLELPSNPRVRSELFEFRGIAEAQLDFPEKIVRRTFEEAIRTDDGNKRAGRNLEIYDDMIGKNKKKEWERPTENLLKLSAPQVLPPFSMLAA